MIYQPSAKKQQQVEARLKFEAWFEFSKFVPMSCSLDSFGCRLHSARLINPGIFVCKILCVLEPHNLVHLVVYLQWIMAQYASWLHPRKLSCWLLQPCLSVYSLLSVDTEQTQKWWYEVLLRRNWCTVMLNSKSSWSPKSVPRKLCVD